METLDFEQSGNEREKDPGWRGMEGVERGS